MQYIYNTENEIQEIEDEYTNFEGLKRLDAYLALKLDMPRAKIQKMIENNKITVNEKSTKSSYQLKNNDIIDVQDLDICMSDIKPENIPLNIIYEDEDIIILDKEKGMAVHPGAGNFDGTVVNALMYSHADKLSDINGVIRPGIVHRIDKDTTGIIVVAKNNLSHNFLAEQFKVHSINRKYIALVNGIIQKDKLRINLPIGRDSKNRLKMAVTTKNSKEAITNISVIKRYPKSGYTLIEAALETGRTHQIRVHMSYIGYPLVGDDVYGTRLNEFGIDGQLLHATCLGFVHPTTKQYVEFNSKVHAEFQNILDILDKRNEQ